MTAFSILISLCKDFLREATQKEVIIVVFMATRGQEFIKDTTLFPSPCRAPISCLHFLPLSGIMHFISIHLGYFLLYLSNSVF
ncbi:MAG: hypothetical protein CV087_17795 [Candidatus Brocadia sp. WS118]|nr:MAG: hypothetical protein CV087_17795 [Candidatus Brocadia sp. WS118]